MKNESRTLDHAFAILEVIRKHGCEAMICGGYARDKALGAEPKDLDILVPKAGEGSVNVVVLALQEMGYGGVNELMQEMPGYVLLPMYDVAEGDRIKACIKIPSLDIDIVLYDADTVGQGIDMFDANLSQFVIAGTRKDHRPVYVGQDDINELVWLRDDMTADRKLRVAEKFLKLIAENPHPVYGEIVEAVADADARYHLGSL